VACHQRLEGGEGGDSRGRLFHTEGQHCKAPEAGTRPSGCSRSRKTSACELAQRAGWASAAHVGPVLVSSHCDRIPEEMSKEERFIWAHGLRGFSHGCLALFALDQRQLSKSLWECVTEEDNCPHGQLGSKERQGGIGALGSSLRPHPSDLTSSQQAPPLKGTTISLQHHGLMTETSTHGPLGYISGPKTTEEKPSVAVRSPWVNAPPLGVQHVPGV
jgi:hypothetical protein